MKYWTEHANSFDWINFDKISSDKKKKSNLKVSFFYSSLNLFKKNILSKKKKY